MSVETGKLAQSKRRARRKGASLSFANKLRVIEQLREETIVRLPKQEHIHVSSDEGQGTVPRSLLLEVIRHAVHKRRRGREVAAGSDEEKRLAAEVDSIVDQPERGLEALDALFPEGVPDSLAFYDRLTDLVMRLGWGEISHRATGVLLTLAVDRLSADVGEALLLKMPQVPGPQFFQALGTLPGFLSRKELRPEFAAEWFPALVRRIGNDLASGEFWKALETYCEHQTKGALAVLICLSKTEVEEHISVAAFILGVLRSLELSDAIRAQFHTLESELLTSAASGTRSIYHRSWIRTAWRGKLRMADLESLTRRMSAGSSKEQEDVFWIVCQSMISPSVPEDCFAFALDWLREHASPTIVPIAKFHVIEFADRISTVHYEEAAELMLLVQPISAEHKGIWQRIEHFLVGLLNADEERFTKFCLELARKSAGDWLEVMRGSDSLQWFLSELRNKDTGNLVGRLIFSPSANARQLGIFLFCESTASIIPASILEAVGENQARVAFHELQRGPLRGKSLARHLIFLIPCGQRYSSTFRAEFEAELVLQLKNYPGSSREEFARRMDTFPILKAVIEEVDRYFASLRQADHSGINAMDLPGYRHAVGRYRRQFSNAVSKNSEEASIFIKLMRKTQLLYGKAWSAFQAVALGNSHGLQKISVSEELPRMEIIDPEGMALRRLHAAMTIFELEKAVQIEAKDGQQ
jgi:hypothetical protein